MPVAWACVVHFVQKFAAIELLAQVSSILILLAAGILVFRAFRERHLLAWLIAWLLYLVYRISSGAVLLPHTPAVEAMATCAFIISVAMFAAAVLYYTNARRYLVGLAALAAVTVTEALVRAIWFPDSRLFTLALHALYMVMTVGAALRLALFSRRRRELGPWLAALMLALVHLDEVPNSPHAQAGVDFIVEMFLGLSMVMIVLDDSKARARRLAVVNAITTAVAIAQNRSALMLRALREFMDLMSLSAAWHWVLQGERLVLAEHIGLPEQFLRDGSIQGIADSFGTMVVRQGQPGVFHRSKLDPGIRQRFADQGLEHVLMVPVRGKNSIIGALALAGRRNCSYTPDELNFLLVTANQLGISLESLGLFEQILQSQQQWRSTFDSIEDPILVHDSGFRILRVNRALLDRLGRPHTEVISRTCAEVLPHAAPWQQCPYCDAARAALDGADPCFGGHSLVSTSSSAEPGPERLGTIHVIKDTSEQRQTEERYRKMFEQVQEGVFISTPEGRILQCNDAFVRMLGYDSREELFGLDLAHQLYLVPEDRESYRREMAAHNFVRNYEVTLRRKDGSLLIALENSFATRDASGQVDRYQGFLLDITEKKRAEEEIRRRNRELHALNAIAVIATQSFDLDEILNLTLRHVMDLFTADVGSVYLFDDATCVLRRRAERGHRTEAGAQAAEVKLPPEIWAQIRQAHTELITQHSHSSQLPSVATELIAAENLRSWIWCIMWSKDKMIGLFGIASHQWEFSGMDENLMIAISRQLATTIDKVHLYEETCRAYDDLRRAQEQLLQSEKMSALGQLISGVAHELNSPLTAILGYAQLLEGEDIGARCQDYVQKLFKQAQRTQRVVQNLLSFARQRKPQKSQVDLRRVVEDTLALRDYDLKLNNLAVEREFQANLPTVTADAHQLEQVFLNIINNAADAMLENARGGLLKVRIYAENEQVCVEFRDSGPGIKEPHRVFDPFYTTKPVGKGTGLGLSICYGIVKEHRGDVLAQNAPGGGAMFRIMLPASGALAPPPAATAPKRRELVLQGRVLIIDDEEAVLDFEREVLSGAGADVVAVSSGEQSLLRLQRQRFDAIIVDAKMPGRLAGINIYRWVAKNLPGREKTILFTLSNITDSETRAFLEETGAPCIVKPFEVADLIGMTRRLLEHSRAAGASQSDLPPR